MAVASNSVTIEGLREFQAALKKADGYSQTMLRVVLNNVATPVAHAAQGNVPRRSGAAAGSIRVASSQREARVKAGGAKAPYYPWLDFGGSVGRKGSVHRPFIKKGRYLYPAYEAHRDEVVTQMEYGLALLSAASGIDITTGGGAVK